MKITYVFISDSGYIDYVEANSRSDAINRYHDKTAMPIEFIKKHCRIVNQGKGEH